MSSHSQTSSSHTHLQDKHCRIGEAHASLKIYPGKISGINDSHDHNLMMRWSFLCRCINKTFLSSQHSSLFSPRVYLLFDISTCGQGGGNSQSCEARGGNIRMSGTRYWYDHTGAQRRNVCLIPSHLTPSLMHFWLKRLLSSSWDFQTQTRSSHLATSLMT